ncbi:hypothetical protein HFO56_39590 [Rhizobium laguerreae]|uniref:hypothetical protein n=1 Tax=Rhizobium laguerreae TaxID=1076926 RepID=UPI001C9180CC|nr:hypothetical protein [Rhizobium laguerreae]MBY3158405.1 hypothetical protein [Rhizobium laguerreae]
MSNTEKSIVLTWRDENYGQVRGSVAFRAAIEPYPSDAAKAKVVRAYKAAGFELHSVRQAWIAPDSIESIPATLVEKLEAIGYKVTHDGVVPPVLEDEAKEAATPASGPKI